MTLSTLRTRLETATEADQAEVLEMAFDVFLTKPGDIWADDKIRDWTPEYTHWQALSWKASNMIEVVAYTDAALLIMREALLGWSYSIIDEHTAVMHHPIHPSMDARADGMPTSLAIIAAICAAKGDDDVRT